MLVVKGNMFRIKISLADKYFSLKIRSRDNWTCQRCHAEYEPPTASLQCSHFWSRGNKSVRFDEENAVALCYGCHRILGSNPVLHREFFLERLGEEKFDALNFRARIPAKVDIKAIALGLKLELIEKGIIKPSKRDQDSI